MAKLNLKKYLSVLNDFAYDESSPSKLKWVCTRNGVCIGDNAGSLHSNGYYSVNVFKSAYLCHIVVYLLHNGTIPDGLEIDHFDGDSSNNVIGNLRAVTSSINSQNKKIRKTNNSGYIGISYRSGKHPGWRARVTMNGVVHSKSFHINDELTKEDALSLAIAWRIEFINKANQNGAAFTERGTI